MSKTTNKLKARGTNAKRQYRNAVLRQYIEGIILRMSMAMELSMDRTLYGCAFVDQHGNRVDPTTVKYDPGNGTLAHANPWPQI